MQNNYLQQVIANNAERITNFDIQIGDLQDKAAELKAKGEIAFSLAAYAKVQRIRAKLKKSVELQRVLKAEMAFNTRLSRAAKRFKALCAALGLASIDTTGLTSYELDEEADAIAALPTASVLDPDE